MRIGRPRITTRDVDAGVLGVRYNPFKIDTAGVLPANVAPAVGADVVRRRLALAEKLDGEFARSGGAAAVAEKQQVYDRTARLVLSPRVGTFDLSSEPEALRDAYGRTNFGQGCLLARRLVEQGVSFVEVISTGSISDQGWDTHKLGFEQQPPLCARGRPGLFHAANRPGTTGACSKTRWWSGWASLAARPSSNPTAAASIIPMAGSSACRAPASAAAR